MIMMPMITIMINMRVMILSMDIIEKYDRDDDDRGTA